MSDDVWVLYARKSPDPRHRTATRQRSVSEQERDGRARVAEEGGTIHAVEYEDRAVSASRFARGAKGKRDAWARTLEHIRNPAVNRLWLWESSRGDRTLESWAAMLSLCRNHGVMIYVETHERLYDMNNARDWRSLAEDGVDSAYESEKTSRRVRRMKRAQLVDGKPDGRVAYGYERIYDAKTRELIEQRGDPVRAPVVREIFTRVAAGDPISAIVADLQRRGVPAATEGKAWSRNVVRRIATNLVYIAQRKSGGEVFAGQWPALVDEDVFWKAQRVLSDPARLVTRPGRVKYLCSYFAICAVCEGQLSASKRGARSARYYVCPKGCIGVRVDWLDDYVGHVVVERVSRPDIYPDLVDVDDSEVVAAREEAERLRARLEEYYDEAADGKLSAAGLARVEARLLPKIEAAEKRATLAATPAPLRELLGPVDEMWGRWQDMSMAARKEVLRVLLRTIRVHPSGRVRPGMLDTSRVEPIWREPSNAVRLVPAG